jgi:hypothetical protein
VSPGAERRRMWSPPPQRPSLRSRGARREPTTPLLPMSLREYQGRRQARQRAE